MLAYGCSPLPNRALADDIIHDLEDTGLYELAGTLLEDIKRLPDSTPGSPLLPGSIQTSPAYQEQRYRGKQPMTGAPLAAPGHPHQSAVMINTAADVAASRAAEALVHAKRKLHELYLSSPPLTSGLTSPDSASAKARRTVSGKLRSPLEAAQAGRAPGKGLRHFSMKVCEKVQGKGRTTYNEVADELVLELSSLPVDDGDDPVQYDEKNIRRRVYDAINVLMAMDIIRKEKKDIIWRGFPSQTGGGGGGGGGSAADAHKRAALLSDVQQKAQYLQDLVTQQQALKALLERNQPHGLGAGGSADCGEPPGTALQLPFILVVAKPDVVVDVQISDPLTDVQFDFYNSSFEIHDDVFVLRALAAQSAARHAAADQAVGGSRAAGGQSSLQQSVAQQQALAALARQAGGGIDGIGGMGIGGPGPSSGNGGMGAAWPALNHSGYHGLPAGPAMTMAPQPARRVPRTAMAGLAMQHH